MDDAFNERYDVCMITTRHPLRDHRVFHKEAVSLARQLGLRVLVLAIAKQDTVEREGSIVIRGIRGSQLDILQSVLRVARVLPRVRARVFHIHDFECLLLVPYLKLLHRAPIVYDVHEHYDLMIRNVVALPDLVRGPLALIVDAYERVFSRMSDELILVEDPQKPRFARFSIPEARMTVVRNFAALAGFRGANVEKRYDLVYCGTCYSGRGIFEIIDAIELARQRDAPRTLLLILSGKPDELDKAKQRVAALRLEDRIEIRTHLPYDAVPSAIAAAKVGIVLFHDAPAHRIAIPTKLVEYGAAGLPTLVNDVNRFSVEYVERYRAGTVIAGCEPAAILDGVARIERNYDEYTANARQAAEQNCWEHEESKLIGLYGRLLAATPIRVH